MLLALARGGFCTFPIELGSRRRTFSWVAIVIFSFVFINHQEELFLKKEKEKVMLCECCDDDVFIIIFCLEGAREEGSECSTRIDSFSLYFNTPYQRQMLLIQARKEVF